MGVLINPFVHGGGGGSPPTDPDFASVLFLSGFEGVDGATTFTDESSHARTITTVGNAQADTAIKKYGDSGLLLDGTGDYLTIPDHADWEFAGEFTLEAWVYISSAETNSTVVAIVAHDGNSSNLSYRLSITKHTATPSLQFGFSTNGSTYVHSLVYGGSSSTIPTDTWLHVAIDRDGADKMRLWLDGVMRGSKLSATGTAFNSANALGIGATGTGNDALMGSLDEVRISSISRYGDVHGDTTFTPPAAAFPRS